MSTTRHKLSTSIPAKSISMNSRLFSALSPPCTVRAKSHGAASDSDERPPRPRLSGHRPHVVFESLKVPTNSLHFSRLVHYRNRSAWYFLSPSRPVRGLLFYCLMLQRTLPSKNKRNTVKVEHVRFRSYAMRAAKGPMNPETKPHNGERIYPTSHPFFGRYILSFSLMILTRGRTFSRRNSSVVLTSPLVVVRKCFVNLQYSQLGTTVSFGLCPHGRRT